MCNFHVGQKVVCIGSFEPSLTGKETFPSKNHVYTIRDVIPAGGEQEFGLLLAEIRNKPRYYTDTGYLVFCECAFDADAFRPVRTTSIDIFHRLLNPTPEDLERIKEREDA